MKIANKIGIIGGGSWATAIVKILQFKSKKINWWVRRQESVDFIYEYKHNPEYLSSVEFNTDLLHISTEIEEIIRKSDILIFVIPAAFIKNTLDSLDPNLLKDRFVISAIKGIIPETNETVSQYFINKFDVPVEHFGMIAGPCHAEEVIMDKKSYLTIASENGDLNNLMSELLTSRATKISLSCDIQGIEYSAILKNVYAVAAGVSAGLGLGDNFLSVLTTNAILELRNFLDAINHHKRDVNKSAYLGDIIVTAYSQHSRNRAFGVMIGKGYSISYTKIEMKQVAEGYFAAKAMKEVLENYKVEMPILDTMYNILYNNSSPRRAMMQLGEKLS